VSTAVRLGRNAGDWLLLAEGVPHRVVEVDPGAWLAVHLHPYG
jgi:hypothetical protein